MSHRLDTARRDLGDALAAARASLAKARVNPDPPTGGENAEETDVDEQAGDGDL
jgi:hypothetical protein